jgi:hypothetical protein
MFEHDLIDNRERPLTQAVASLLERSSQAHMVLGHLFVPGLAWIPMVPDSANKSA